jgi:hypothetical protein
MALIMVATVAFEKLPGAPGMQDLPGQLRGEVKVRGSKVTVGRFDRQRDEG